MSNRTMRRSWIGMGLACFFLGPISAHAHLVQTGFGTFYDGVAHVFLTPADLLLVVGLALLAGSSGPAAARSMLFALPSAWFIGALAGSAIPIGNSFQSLTTFSFGLAGVLVALNVKLPRTWLIGLAEVSGLIHGFANDAPKDWLCSAGATTAIFSLITLLAALVVSLRAYWARITVRVAGSWIAATGLLMLGWLARGKG
jgi:urease accessory protein